MSRWAIVEGSGATRLLPARVADLEKRVERISEALGESARRLPAAGPVPVDPATLVEALQVWMSPN